ncbi:PREDICTED: transmembrane protein 98-like [Ceratosolen solmsi marchali]|uniref:Transmembrane protein 98 n=1 Tax=Ceratosolen solmsi marchali TaxID=326594 RepID=A0AAJ7DWQ6_9HYME|nr:PREDICTED: transmembrane protein 98-like [Ceratosolen solmsi marchali]
MKMNYPSISVVDAVITTTAPAMETIDAVALASLAAVFLGALLVLLVICKKQRCYYNQKYSQDMSSDLLEGDNLGLGLHAWETDEWLAGAERWVDDATGLAPPCIAILRYCHSLARRISTTIESLNSSSTLPLEIIDIARCIPQKADDVVLSLYPPIDARLLEARVVALVLTVTHLGLVTKHGVSKSQAKKLAFIDQAINDTDHYIRNYLLILRNAALAQEAACSIPASTTV